MSSSLLPKNSTILEKAIEEVSLRASNFTVHFDQLLDPDLCPEGLLPYLAWAEKVEVWDLDFVDILTPKEMDLRRRDIIKSFRLVRSLRGTIKGIDLALKIIGVKARFKEWWDYPKGEEKFPYTFVVSLTNLDNVPITEEQRFRVLRLIDSLKPLRSEYGLKIIFEAKAHEAYASLLRVTRVYRITTQLRV